jgi:hypothetical protein
MSASAVLRSYRLPGAGVLEVALDEMRAILRGSEDNAIAVFNASHRSIKDAIKRGAEIEQALSEPRLRDLERARNVLQSAWPFLRDEADLPEDLRVKAGSLQDLLNRETFFRELPAIEQYARDLDDEYQRRFRIALDQRVEAYTNAFGILVKTPDGAIWQKIKNRRSPLR